VVHELLIGEGREADVEEVFGPSGIWRALLRRSKGYVRSELDYESRSERVYKLRDLWTSHVEFEAFRERFTVDYDRLKQLLIEEGLLEKQTWLGSFYTYEEPGEGTQLTPA
jgi:hypothetical protein